MMSAAMSSAIMLFVGDCQCRQLLRLDRRGHLLEELRIGPLELGLDLDIGVRLVELRDDCLQRLGVFPRSGVPELEGRPPPRRSRIPPLAFVPDVVSAWRDGHPARIAARRPELPRIITRSLNVRPFFIPVTFLSLDPRGDPFDEAALRQRGRRPGSAGAPGWRPPSAGENRCPPPGGRPRGRPPPVRIPSLFVTRSGQSRAFQLPRKAKIATVASAGCASGAAIRQRNCQCAQPSSSAASKKSRGRPRKNCVSRKTEKTFAVQGTISAGYAVQPSEVRHDQDSSGIMQHLERDHHRRQVEAKRPAARGTPCSEGVAGEERRDDHARRDRGGDEAEFRK